MPLWFTSFDNFCEPKIKPATPVAWHPAKRKV
ncbi:MAG: hypothetical protein ACI8P0_003854 [Planctomycetaceae bacterium]